MFDIRVFIRPSLWQWSVFHRTVGKCGYACKSRRDASIDERQPVGLHTHRYRNEYNKHSDAGEGDIMNMDYPFQFDVSGHTATAGNEKHIRDMIEQVLFTSPGERVNRPDFGCGLMQLVFAPNSDVLSNAVVKTVHGALQQWLGHLIQIEEVSAENVESSLIVNVKYMILSSQKRRVDEFRRSI